MIPGEFTEAIRTVTEAFGDKSPPAPHAKASGTVDIDVAEAAPNGDETPQIGYDGTLALERNGHHEEIEALDAVRAADEVAKNAEAAVSEAKAEVEAVEAAVTRRPIPET